MKVIFIKGQWNRGPDFPVAQVGGGVSVPYGDTFLMVGGENFVHEALYLIYKFDIDTHTFVKLEQRMAIPRSSFAAFLVPKDLLSC